MSDVSSNVSSFTQGLSADRSGELNSTEVSQMETALSLSESVSLDIVPYLKPSNTDFPTGELLPKSFVGFKGNFALGVQLGGLTVPLKKDWSVFCVGAQLEAFVTLDLVPELELKLELEKAAFRPARFREDFGVCLTGSSPGSGTLSLDETT